MFDHAELNLEIIEHHQAAQTRFRELTPDCLKLLGDLPEDSMLGGDMSELCNLIKDTGVDIGIAKVVRKAS